MLVKSLVFLTVIALICGSNAQFAQSDVFAIAEKLSTLFNAISNNKLDWQQKESMYKFQLTIMNTWETIKNAVKDIQGSQILDAYVALINNQRELLSQLFNVFNLDELNKWSQIVADTLRNVTSDNFNCNSTGCSFTTPSWNFNDSTWYPTGSTPTWNWNNTDSWITELPWNFSTGSWDNNTDSWNTTDFNWFTELPWNFTTYYPSDNNTDWYWETTEDPSNSTWDWNETTADYNDTTWNPWYTTDSQNFTDWETTDYDNNSTSNETTPYPGFTTLSHFYVDSEFCQYYSLNDCDNRIEISLLCPAMCRCSTNKCLNNGTLAITTDGACKCMCKPDFTGSNCESNLCNEKEYCSYFNDSYCTVQMIEENCPKLCGKC